MNEFGEILVENPLVAAIRNDEDLERILKSNVLIVFVLYGSIVSIQSICEKLKEKGKIVFVHLDMVEGLKGDIKGIEFIKEFSNPYGIITTKNTNIKYAKNIGLYTIQRVFIIDSLSLQTGVKNILAVAPDAVEIMPGVASKIISAMEKQIHLPIIAGGLIQTKKEVMDSLAAGAMAVSTSCYELWDLK